MLESPVAILNGPRLVLDHAIVQVPFPPDDRCDEAFVKLGDQVAVDVGD